MKKRMNSGLRVLLASILIIIAVMSLSGCLFNAPPEDPNAPKPIPMDQLSEDDRAAADALIKYFDAYSAKDVETMADSLCSDCRGQIISLSPGDPRYIWYMRAVRAFYFDRMNFIYCCQSSRLKKCAPKRR